jgi:2-polyprenyl-3-methyl-5-hydroxy-6-metoxy-1,4-benzoquinol methylase
MTMPRNDDEGDKVKLDPGDGSKQRMYRLGHDWTWQARPYRWLRSIYVKLLRMSGTFLGILRTKKPAAIKWRDFVTILLTPIRYQPLLFPPDEVIPPRRDASILDSRAKLAAIGLPDDLSGKTVLDIGCAEGFFVVQAALRGAERAMGCDLVPSRLRLARISADSWQLGDRVTFSAADLYSIPPEWASDIVMCFAVAHHLHASPGEPSFHDTWQMIVSPDTHAEQVENMMRAVAAVASLTKEATYWEYCFEYQHHKPPHVDHAALGRWWVRKGLYKRVDFLGLSQALPLKDRALYCAYR